MIWLIGKNGCIGSEIALQLEKRGFYWVGTDSEIDVTDYSALENFLKSKETENYYSSHRKFKDPEEGKISWIINCASLSDFDKCEENPEKAFEINEKGALNVSRLARSVGAKLIHFSETKFKAGTKGSKIYLESKKKGDEEVISSITQCYVIKTGKVFGTNEEGFLSKTVKNLVSGGKCGFEKENTSAFYASSKTLSVLVLLFIEKTQKATKLFGKKSAPSYGLYDFSLTDAGNVKSGEKDFFEMVIDSINSLKKASVSQEQLFEKENSISEAQSQNLMSDEEKSTSNSGELTTNKKTDDNRSVFDSDFNPSKIEKLFKLKTPCWKEELKKSVLEILKRQ